MIQLTNKRQVKDQLIGDDAQLQVWAGKTWEVVGIVRELFGIGTTYLIKNLIYKPTR